MGYIFPISSSNTLPKLFSFFLAFWLASVASAETKLRAMTGNITSGTEQSYDEGHGARIFHAFAPQVAMVQEFNYGDNSEHAIREFVDRAFGKNYFFYREPSEGDSKIPNGIVSAWPILESGVLTDPTINNRGIAWAKIDLPGTTKLWVFSAHYSHDGGGRRTQASKVVVDFVMKRVKSGEYLIFGADANTTNRDEEAIRVLKTVFADKFIPVGSDGKAGTNAARNKPYDLLLSNPALDRHHVPLELLAGRDTIRFPKGLVFDSRTFRPLEAVPPVRIGDSAAQNMQHMAVIRDFVIP